MRSTVIKENDCEGHTDELKQMYPYEIQLFEDGKEKGGMFLTASDLEKVHDLQTHWLKGGELG